jgi:hypothetical protein
MNKYGRLQKVQAFQFVAVPWSWILNALDHYGTIILQHTLTSIRSHVLGMFNKVQTLTDHFASQASDFCGHISLCRHIDL